MPKRPSAKARNCRSCGYTFALSPEPPAAAAVPSTTAPIDAAIWLGIAYLVLLLVYRVRKLVRFGPQ